MYPQEIQEIVDSFPKSRKMSKEKSLSGDLNAFHRMTMLSQEEGSLISLHAALALMQLQYKLLIINFVE